MKQPPVTQAMILAAGLGNRMRPLTDTRPKPMVDVMGKPIIDYAITDIRSLGIENIIVNTHYKAEILESHLKMRGVKTVHERLLLDTGGGIRNALESLDKNQPLLVVSGDSILVGNQGLAQLINAWDGNEMDILLLLQPLTRMIVTPGIGDYDIVAGKPVRRADQTGHYMWTSARILHPRIFDAVTDEIFSFLPLMDAAQAAGRLQAVVHNGTWHHLTTPADIRSVEAGPK